MTSRSFSLESLSLGDTFVHVEVLQLWEERNTCHCRIFELFLKYSAEYLNSFLVFTVAHYAFWPWAVGKGSSNSIQHIFSNGFGGMLGGAVVLILCNSVNKPKILLVHCFDFKTYLGENFFFHHKLRRIATGISGCCGNGIQLQESGGKWDSALLTLLQKPGQPTTRGRPARHSRV